METPKITQHAIKKKRKRIFFVGIFTILKLDAIRKTKKKKKEKRPISVQRLSGLGGGEVGGGWLGGWGGGCPGRVDVLVLPAAFDSIIS